MALRDHKIMEWTGSPVHGNNAALAAYRLHNSTN